MPAQTYAPETRLPMYWNVPRPSTYAEYQANLRKGYQQVGTLPVSETYRSFILAGNLESMTTGGLNEHGLSIAIEFLPMREGLACDKGRVGPNSNHWTTSLIANGLLRAHDSSGSDPLDRRHGRRVRVPLLPRVPVPAWRCRSPMAVKCG